MTASVDQRITGPLNEVVQQLVKTFAPEQIYLFGSQARGDASGDSDYDVLVVVRDSDQPPYRRAQDAYRGLVDIAVAIDVLVFTRAEFDQDLPARASLPATVLREGRLLYAA